MAQPKTFRNILLTASAMTFVALGTSKAISQEVMVDDTSAATVAGSTLQDAMAYGITNNPEFGTVASSRRATSEELRQGRAGYLPSVDLRGDTGFEYTDDQGTRNRLGSDDDTLFRYEIGATLTQMLFDGFDTRYEVERQKARVNSSANRVRETVELLGLSIVEAYLEVMRQRQLLTIARQNVAQHLDILQQIQDGVGAGRSTQADLEQARARLANAQANESNTRQSLRTAEAQYNREVGQMPGNLQLTQAPFEAIAQSVDAEVQQTLSFSPTLDIFASDIEVAKAEYNQTQAPFYPQLDLQLNARQGEDLGGIEGVDKSASALVVMNWNLYRGGADTARRREFVHRTQQARHESADAARQVENDVRSTWASMVAAGERANQFATQAEANAEVVRAYKDQFSLDRRSLLDVLDSQNELFVSRSNTINAEYLEMFAVYRLLALKGKLLPSMGMEYPKSVTLNNSTSWASDDTRSKLN